MTITGTVQAGEVSVTSQTGDVEIDGYYQAIGSVATAAMVEAPDGNVTLTSNYGSGNLISGSSGYSLSVTAGGTLRAEGLYGIQGFGTATLKAEDVQVALTEVGYGFLGGTLTIENPSGGNCASVSISGGGSHGAYDVIAVNTIVIKADDVRVIACDSGSKAINSGTEGGSVTIGDAGMIVGAVDIKGTDNIAGGVKRYACGPEVSTTGLDLSGEKVTKPTAATCYKAGDGYMIYTPADSTATPATSATVTLHNATIDASAAFTECYGQQVPNNALILKEVAILKLEGENRLIASSVQNGGWTAVALAMYEETEGRPPLTIEGQTADASLSLSAWQCTSLKALTISGGRVTMTGACYGLVAEGNVTLQNGTQVSLTGGEGGAALQVKDLDKTPANLTVEGGSALVVESGELFVAGDLAVRDNSFVTNEQKASFVTGTITADPTSAFRAVTGKYEAGTFSGTVYGSVAPSPVLAAEIAGYTAFSLPSGTALTVSTGVTLDLSNLTLTKEGKLVNNGTLILPGGITPEQIKDENFTGTGVVQVVKTEASGETPATYDTYTNDGTALNTVSGDLDLRNAETSDQLASSGYRWNKDTKALTLKNIYVNGDIKLPDNSKVVIQETASAENLTGGNAGGTMDVSGGSLILSGNLSNMGSVTLDSTDFTGGIYNANVGSDKVLALKNSTLSSDSFNWMTNGGVALEASTLSAGPSQFWAEKIVMDAASVINMYAPLSNYGNVTNGLDGIRSYLPSGNTIGSYGESNTILNAGGQPAAPLTLKKQSAPSSGDGGGGVTPYAVTVTKPSGGTLTASASSAAAGKIVTLTIAPAEGHTLDTLTVTDKNGKSVTVTKTGDTSYTFPMPASNVTVAALFKTASPAGWVNSFTDVKEGDWFYDAVKDVSEKGFFQGTSGTAFAPNTVMTRGMLVTALWRMGNKPVVNYAMTFRDVAQDAYYGEAVRWAAAEKIVGGYSTEIFAPDDTITREQMAAILYRYAAYKNCDTTQGGMELREFADYDSISDYALTAMAWAVNTQLILGMDGKLQPQGGATRAQVATILMRFAQSAAQ